MITATETRVCLQSREARSGYTLLELTLVLALIVTIGALALPSVRSGYYNYRLTSASDQIRAAWAAARARSLEEGRPYQFAIVPGKGNYRVAPDAPAYWSDASLPSSGDLENPPLVLEGALAPGFIFSSLEGLQAGSFTAQEDTVLTAEQVSPNSWVKQLVFLPDGTAQEDAAIGVQGPNGRSVVLRLRALTGFARVRPLEADEKVPSGP